MTVAKKPKPPRGPRNLKAGGFTNGLWRLQERKAAQERSMRKRKYKYSVYQFFDDGSNERVRHGVGAVKASDVAHIYSLAASVRMGRVIKVIVTDSGGYTNYVWEYGKGVTFI